MARPKTDSDSKDINRRLAFEGNRFNPDTCPLITCNRCAMDFLIAPPTSPSITKHKCRECARVFFCRIRTGEGHRPVSCVDPEDHKRYMEGY